MYIDTVMDTRIQTVVFLYHMHTQNLRREMKYTHFGIVSQSTESQGDFLDLYIFFSKLASISEKDNVNKHVTKRYWIVIEATSCSVCVYIILARPFT